MSFIGRERTTVLLSTSWLWPSIACLLQMKVRVVKHNYGHDRYSMTGSIDADLAVLQRGCFSYFKFGGLCVSEPVGLLSGLIQRPIILVYHFFAVAFHAIKIEAISNGWAGAHRSFIMFFTVLYAACVTILPYLWSETKY